MAIRRETADSRSRGPFGSHPQSQSTIDPYGAQSPGGLPKDYEPGFGWHTFRVEVLGNEVRLLVDGVQIGDANCSQTETLSNGPLGVSTDVIGLRVSSLQITALSRPCDICMMHSKME